MLNDCCQQKQTQGIARLALFVAITDITACFRAISDSVLTELEIASYFAS